MGTISLEAELVEEVLDAGGLLLGLDVLLVQVPVLEDLPHGLLHVGRGSLDGGLVHHLLEVDVHLVTAPSARFRTTKDRYPEDVQHGEKEGGRCRGRKRQTVSR